MISSTAHDSPGSNHRPSATDSCQAQWQRDEQNPQSRPRVTSEWATSHVGCIDEEQDRKDDLGDGSDGVC